MKNRNLLLMAGFVLAVILAACTAPATQTAAPAATDEATEATAEPTEPAATEAVTEPPPTAEPTEALEPIPAYTSPREVADVVPSPRIIAYFTSWAAAGRGFHVKQVETSGSADKVHVINYAFAAPFTGRCLLADPQMDIKRIYGKVDSVDGVGNGNDAIKGHWGQLIRLKAMHPDLKVLISIGGWTLSNDFHEMSMPEHREEFVRNCIDLFINGNVPGYPERFAKGVFDGIDIDWEYPNMEANGNKHGPEDTRNFTLLLAEFRIQMDAIDPNLMLTIAAPAGEAAYSQIELDKIHPFLDWINVMTYDYHGSWERQGPSNFNAPLYSSPDDPAGPQDSVDASLKAYLAAGIPPEKITMGIPFYGRGWTGVGSENNGLYQPADAPAPGPAEAGFMDYNVIVNNFKDQPGFFDEVTQSFYYYDGTVFWSVDNEQTIALKMAYVKEHGLGGAMIWELASDTRDGQLITALWQGLFGDQ